MSNIEAWERWAEIIPAGAARTFNLSLIRLVKGCVKAGRLYLIEQGQTNHIQSSRLTLPPSASEEAANASSRQNHLLQRNDQG